MHEGQGVGVVSAAFGLSVRALPYGYIRSRRMHLFDDGSSYGCTRRTEAARRVGLPLIEYLSLRGPGPLPQSGVAEIRLI